MNAKTYELTTKHRTFRLTIVEMTDRIDVTMQVTKFGIFDDIVQFVTWYRSLTAHYDSDPRPMTMVNPHTGEQTTVFGDREFSFAVISEPNASGTKQ